MTELQELQTQSLLAAGARRQRRELRRGGPQLAGVAVAVEPPARVLQHAETRLDVANAPRHRLGLAAQPGPPLVRAGHR